MQSTDFEVNAGVGQDSALSPILSALYLTPFVHILEKCLKILKIPISMLSFVDNGLIIAQNKSILILNSQLFCSYNVLSNILTDFGLVIEYRKTEIFHFNRSHRKYNPPSLDLTPLGGPILHPKDSWKYLGFFFDRKLTFRQHLDFYSNKVLSMVKCMKLLGNLSRRISPLQKRQLYRCCILPIALYGFQLWFCNKAPLSYHMKLLNKMQRRAAIWILGTFKTSPSEGIEALAGIIPIRFHLQKLANCSLIWPFKIPENHIIQSLMNDSPHRSNSSNPHTIGSLTNHQRNIIKGHIIDSKTKSYGIFPSFTPLHQEFTPGHHILDKFSDHFSFNLVDKKEKDNIRVQELDNLVLQNSLPSSTLVVTDTSIKDNITTLVVHVHQANSPLIKTVHYAVFVTSSEAELFAMRCGINQACNKDNISKIIIITDSIHSAKRIFNSSLHPLQSHSAAILSKLHLFFNKSQDNSIEFWECPSHLK